MKRREFISLLGGAAAWPLAARAQQPARIPKVGVLHPGQAATMTARIAAIREGLSERDSQHESAIELIVQLADGDLARLPALATDLVGNRVDVLLAAGPCPYLQWPGHNARVP
jgi:putative ABC transport system substrate-binding protein